MRNFLLCVFLLAATGCGTAIQKHSTQSPPVPSLRVATSKAQLVVQPAAPFSSAALVTQAELSWPPSPDGGPQWYNVYYGDGPRHYYQIVQAGIATNKIISGLTPGSEYFFAVTAVSDDGTESDYSEELDYTLPMILEMWLPFDRAVKNVSVQNSLDLKNWGPSEAYQWTTGSWRVVINPELPTGFYRAIGAPEL